MVKRERSINKFEIFNQRLELALHIPISEEPGGGFITSQFPDNQFPQAFISSSKEDKSAHSLLVINDSYFL
jgi:hypothetical protein